MYKCPAQDKAVVAVKRNTLHRLPNVVMVQFKRTEFTEYGSRKIQGKVGGRVGWVWRWVGGSSWVAVRVGGPTLLRGRNTPRPFAACPPAPHHLPAD